jgi:hypothetical protein
MDGNPCRHFGPATAPIPRPPAQPNGSFNGRYPKSKFLAAQSKANSLQSVSNQSVIPCSRRTHVNTSGMPIGSILNSTPTSKRIMESNPIQSIRILSPILFLTAAMPVEAEQMSDDFSDRLRLSGETATLSADTTSATMEVDEKHLASGRIRQHTV